MAEVRSAGPVMLHRHPPVPCWCGTTHTPGQVFDLRGLDGLHTPDTYDEAAAAGVREPDR